MDDAARPRPTAGRSIVTATARADRRLQRQVRLLEDDLRARVENAARAGRRGSRSTRRRPTGAHGGVLVGLARRPRHPGRGRLGAHYRLRPVLRGQRASQAGLDRRAGRSAGRRRWTHSSPTSARTRAHRPRVARQAVDLPRARCRPRRRWSTRTPRWLVAPSGDAATALLDVLARPDDAGALVHDLADPALSTRFLGDLYQDLSSTPRTPTRCCRRRSSSRSSSSTGPSSPR